jgi:hypothetical protein
MRPHRLAFPASTSYSGYAAAHLDAANDYPLTTIVVGASTKGIAVATTLGVAVAADHVALTLVAQRRTEPVTLDEVLLETDAEPTTSPADALQQVLAEVQRIIAILGTHKRPLSRIAVAAVEAMAASTAISVVEALTEGGLDSATLVPPPSTQSLAKRHPSNPNLFAATTEIPSKTATLTAAHEIALDALALIPDVSGRALGGGRTRRALALGATTLLTIGVGLIGFRLLSDQSSPEVSPLQPTDPVTTQVTQSSNTPSAPASAVSADPTPAVADTITSAPPPAEVTARPTAAPAQDPLPSSVEPLPPSQDVAPPQGPEPATPATPSPSPAEAVEPPAPTDQRLPGPVPPAPADPQTGQGAPQ